MEGGNVLLRAWYHLVEFLTPAGWGDTKWIMHKQKQKAKRERKVHMHSVQTEAQTNNRITQICLIL